MDTFYTIMHELLTVVCQMYTVEIARLGGRSLESRQQTLDLHAGWLYLSVSCSSGSAVSAGSSQ